MEARRLPLPRLVGKGGAAALVGAGTLMANVLGYAFFLVLSHALEPARFGAVAALLNLVVIAGVPALALQLVVARHVARATPTGDGPLELDTMALRTGLLIGAGSMALMGAASPLLADVLHLNSPWAVVWVGVTSLATCVTFAVQGCLQGHERFMPLAVIYVATGVARFASGAIAAWRGWDTSAVLAATAVAALITAGAACALVVGAFPHLVRARTTWFKPTLVATATTSGLLVLSNVDTPLARHFLAAEAAGGYAVLSIFAKAAFWGPGFLATVAYPSMARHDRRHGLLWASGLTLAIGAVATCVAAAFGPSLILLVGGRTYTSLAPLVPVFVVAGSLLSLTQVLAYASVARDDRRLGYLIWLVTAGIVGAIVLVSHGSVRQIVLAVVAGGLVLVLTGMAIVLSKATGPVAAT